MTAIAWTIAALALALAAIGAFLAVVRFTPLGNRYGYATLARMLLPGAHTMPPGTTPWNPYLFAIGSCRVADPALQGSRDSIRLSETLQVPVRPGLWAGDVTDRNAEFVADPFVVRANGRYHLFFEVKNTRGNGEIGLAESSDGIRWRYRRIVLSEPFHLSYPCVFRHDGGHFMLPETFRAGALRLYRAQKFPTDWVLDSILMEGTFIDPTPFPYRGRWYLFACTRQSCDHLGLYSAPSLRGPWQEHPMSPIVSGDPHIARPGGRVIVETGTGRVFSVRQDCYPTYGNRLHLFEVTRLSQSIYEERMASNPHLPLVSRIRSGWNERGVHPLDTLEDEDGSSLIVFDGCDTFY